MKCKRAWLLLFLCVLLAGAGLVPTAKAAGTERTYILDFAGLLTEDEANLLELRCVSVAGQYKTGVYVLIVDDFTKYAPAGMDVFDFSDEYYYEAKLGLGEERNGLLLVLSMAERDFALYSYGAFAESAFNGDAKNDVLVPAFRSYFSRNDWFGGLDAFVGQADDLARQAAQGKPYAPPKNYGMRAGLILLFSAGTAIIVCLIQKSKHKTVKAGVNANAYVLTDSLRLTRSVDRFTHVTEVRHVKESSSRGGGQSTGSHGGHGVSGKF